MYRRSCLASGCLRPDGVDLIKDIRTSSSWELTAKIKKVYAAALLLRLRNFQTDSEFYLLVCR
jgi:hypothetical protein